MLFRSPPDGYVFVGWNTRADGSGEMIHPGDSLWVDREQPLPNRVYAIWEKAVGPTPSPSPSPTPSPAPTPVPSPAPSPSPTAAPGSSPKTGDSSFLPLYLGLMLFSGSAVLWSLSNQRRRGAHER